MKSRLVLIAICALLLGSAQASDSSKPPAKQPAAMPAIQTLDQAPAVPPQVSFRDGQLTITAQNCTLGDVLKAVHATTGAQVDLPGTGGDRVVGTFGPGPARDVLSALLNGSHFNYVLLGSETDPQALDRVILTARSASPAGSNAPTQEANANSYGGNNYASPQPVNPNMMMRPFPRPGMAPNPNQQNQQDAQADDSSDDDSADDSSDADSTDDADQTDDQSDQTTTVQGEDADTNGNQGVKSPEQLLQELQQQQQQQQQQQGGDQPGGAQPGMPRIPPGVIQPPH